MCSLCMFSLHTPHLLHSEMDMTAHVLSTQFRSFRTTTTRVTGRARSAECHNFYEFLPFSLSQNISEYGNIATCRNISNMVRSCPNPNSTNWRSSVRMSEWSRSQAKLALSACLNGLAFSESRLDSLDFKNRDGGRCSKQLRLVEVDPEEHCRAQGDDENSPAELQQCIARVASMRNLCDGQHCSRDSCCLGCSVLWCSQRSLTAKGGFWGRDECHAGKTKEGQAHSHHQERGRATSHGEQGATELQSLS